VKEKQNVVLQKIKKLLNKKTNLKGIKFVLL
jgi:hypothetical protein